MNRRDVDGDAIDSFCELRMLGKTRKTPIARALGAISRCFPRTLREILLFSVVVSTLIWCCVTFYHGYNVGSFTYYDADLAVNVDCGTKGYTSNRMREACKDAQLAKGVHPFVFATEYTLRTSRDAAANLVLAVVGSSMMMVAVLSVVAFSLALWYVKPSNRTPMFIPGVIQSCGHSIQQPPKEVVLGNLGRPSKHSNRSDSRLNDTISYAAKKPVMFNFDNQTNQWEEREKGD